jgi:prepilin-type processing-associated H-X9-DG protein
LMIPRAVMALADGHVEPCSLVHVM